MGCNLYGVQPMACNLWGATHGGDDAEENRNTHEVLVANCGLQPMEGGQGGQGGQVTLLGSLVPKPAFRASCTRAHTYAQANTGGTLWGAIYGVQPLECNLWGATFGVQPMGAVMEETTGMRTKHWWKLVGCNLRGTTFGVQPMNAVT